MIGSLGFAEVMFIVVLALLVFGPKRLPEVGRLVGRGLGEFRRASNEFKRTLNAEISLEDDEERPKLPRAPRQEDPRGESKSKKLGAEKEPSETSEARGGEEKKGLGAPTNTIARGGGNQGSPAAAVIAGAGMPDADPSMADSGSGVTQPERPIEGPKDSKA